MENCGEVSVFDYLRVMKAYLATRIDVEAYQKEIFRLNPMRQPLYSEEVARILQEVFSRADDYDGVIRNDRTVDEPTLRGHVRRLLDELAALGFSGDDRR